MGQKDQLVLVAQFLDPSAAVFELVWWPRRCFSQAWAPRPKKTTVAIKVAAKKLCMDENLSKITLGALGESRGPGLGEFSLDFVTSASRCCRLLAANWPARVWLAQLPLARNTRATPLLQ